MGGRGSCRAAVDRKPRLGGSLALPDIARIHHINSRKGTDHDEHATAVSGGGGSGGGGGDEFGAPAIRDGSTGDCGGRCEREASAEPGGAGELFAVAVQPQ